MRPSGFMASITHHFACSSNLRIRKCYKRNPTTGRNLHTLQNTIVRMPRFIRNMNNAQASNIDLVRPSSGATSSRRGGCHNKKSFRPAGEPSSVTTSMSFISTYQVKRQKCQGVTGDITHVHAKYITHVLGGTRDGGTA